METTSLLGPLASAEGVIFLVLSISIVGMAIFCMTRKNPVTAVMSLVAAFFGLAGLYATLSAHFLAILQVLVYAGAIMVLFIFVVMILNREETSSVSLRGLVLRIGAVLGGVYVLVVFLRIVIPEHLILPPPVDPSYGTVGAVGDVLFREFLFPFEAISLLLLVAIVGGVVVSRSARKASEEVEAAERRIAIAELAQHDYPGLPDPDAAEAGEEGEHAGSAGSHAAGGHH
jgi:NADH-quinone oxidoreductase subunit J